MAYHVPSADRHRESYIVLGTLLLISVALGVWVSLWWLLLAVAVSACLFAMALVGSGQVDTQLQATGYSSSDEG